MRGRGLLIGMGSTSAGLNARTAARWLLARSLMTGTPTTRAALRPPLIVGEPELEWAAKDHRKTPWPTWPSLPQPHRGRKLDRLVLEARRAADKRAEGYREKALKIYPWICGRCAREFSPPTCANSRCTTATTTDNNPPDGSNWELLCLYCHDNAPAPAQKPPGIAKQPGRQAATHNPFAALAGLIRRNGSRRPETRRMVNPKRSPGFIPHPDLASPRPACEEKPPYRASAQHEVNLSSSREDPGLNKESCRGPHLESPAVIKAGSEAPRGRATSRTAFTS